MIHLLEVDEACTVQSLAKTARRLAMTGGYEMSLKSELTAEQLTTLAELFLPELNKYQPQTSAWKASNANRLLMLIYQHKACSGQLKSKLQQILY